MIDPIVLRPSLVPKTSETIKLQGTSNSMHDIEITNPPPRKAPDTRLSGKRPQGPFPIPLSQADNIRSGLSRPDKRPERSEDP